jgi:hypothetical protein
LLARSLCLLSNWRGKKAFSYSFFFNLFHLSQTWQVPLGVLLSLKPLLPHLERAGFWVQFTDRMFVGRCGLTSHPIK